MLNYSRYQGNKLQLSTIFIRVILGEGGIDGRRGRGEGQLADDDGEDPDGAVVAQVLRNERAAAGRDHECPNS